MSFMRIRKWWRQLSITRRLIIVLTSSFASLIVLFSITLNVIMTHSVWRAAKIYATQEMRTLLSIVGNSTNLHHDLVQELSWRKGEYIFYYGRVTKNGKVLVSTRHMQHIFKHTTFPLNDDLKNLKKLTFKIHHIKDSDYLIAALVPNGKPNILIELALDITYVNKILDLIYETSLWILIFYLVVVVWLARRIIEASLMQLKTITKHFQKITTQHLSLNVDENKFPIELRDLVVRSKCVLSEIDRELVRLVDFASELSHELRTPLQIMLGQTEIAITSQYSQAKMMETLQTNLQELQAMQALVENMMLLSRLDAGKNTLNCEQFSAVDEVYAILASYQIRFQEQQLTYKVVGDVTVHADRI